MVFTNVYNSVANNIEPSDGRIVAVSYNKNNALNIVTKTLTNQLRDGWRVSVGLFNSFLAGFLNPGTSVKLSDILIPYFSMPY